MTTLPHTQHGVKTTAPPLRVETNITLPSGVLLFDVGDVSGDGLVTTISVQAVQTAHQWSTSSLIVVLAVVAFVACLCFAASVFCYRSAPVVMLRAASCCSYRMGK